MQDYTICNKNPTASQTLYYTTLHSKINTKVVLRCGDIFNCPFITTILLHVNNVPVWNNKNLWMFDAVTKRTQRFIFCTTLYPSKSKWGKKSAYENIWGMDNQISLSWRQANCPWYVWDMYCPLRCHWDMNA